MSIGVKLDFCKEESRLDLAISDIFYFSILLIKKSPAKDDLFCSWWSEPSTLLKKGVVSRNSSNSSAVCTPLCYDWSICVEHKTKIIFQ